MPGLRACHDHASRPQQDPRPREHFERTFQPAAFERGRGLSGSSAPVELRVRRRQGRRDGSALVGTRADDAGAGVQPVPRAVRACRSIAAFDLRYLPQRDRAPAEARARGRRRRPRRPRSTATSTIDLGELMREQFYLALPMKPLCRDDCRGLCPECGTNLNTDRVRRARPQWEDPAAGAARRALLNRQKEN